MLSAAAEEHQNEPCSYSLPEAPLSSSSPMLNDLADEVGRCVGALVGRGPSVCSGSKTVSVELAACAEGLGIFVFRERWADEVSDVEVEDLPACTLDEAWLLSSRPWLKAGAAVMRCTSWPSHRDDDVGDEVVSPLPVSPVVGETVKEVPCEASSSKMSKTFATEPFIGMLSTMKRYTS